jgi:hypothetical protein
MQETVPTLLVGFLRGSFILELFVGETRPVRAVGSKREIKTSLAVILKELGLDISDIPDLGCKRHTHFLNWVKIVQGHFQARLVIKIVF